ncbi:MAG: S49 family peptidase [Opitutaceae bacterium]|jgi:protease-4|nr:S49 family peptidase [Opitutaceae bacterium]
MPPLPPLQLLTTLLSQPLCIHPDHLRSIVHGLATTAAAPASSGRTPPWEEPLHTVEDGVAWLSISGTLVKGLDPITCWWYGLASLDRIEQTLTEIEADTTLRALVLVINSPGGSAMGTPEVADHIVRLGERLLTIAHTSDTAASAAQWIATAARLYYPTPSSTVGSIGTYLALYDYSQMLEKFGVKLELFRAGNLKAIGVPGKPFTADEREFLQTRVDRINANFTNFVKTRRPAVSDTTMQGQWFSGAEAVELGLADATVHNLSDILRHLQ